MRLVFAHGWALGPEIWDFLAARLGDIPQVRADLGYFGPPSLPEFSPGDILVGHSAGLLWGLQQRRDWAGVVAINSFSRFVLDQNGRGCAKPAALRAMQKILAVDAPRCVKAFRDSIGAGPTGKPVHAKNLGDGLDLLRDFDAAPILGRKPWLVLGSENDVLAPPGASSDLAEASGGKLVLHASGGHGLPWTAPDFCAEHIVEFMNAHEF